MGRRQSFSSQFIDRFIEIYSKYGKDSACIETMREEFGSQYPLLTCNSLTRLRLKRKQAFDSSRETYLLELKQETSKRERDLRVTARDLNSDLVEIAIENQEDYLEQLRTIDREDPDFERNRLSLLRVAMSLQKEINAFAGLDFQKSINEFTQKLLRKKFIDDKDIESIRKLLSEDGTSDSFESKNEAIPRITLVKEEEDESD